MVNFYITKDDEIVTMCDKCEWRHEVEYVDAAGTWDICCDCGKQNVPEGWVDKHA